MVLDKCKSIIKVGHLYCRICVGIEALNLLRILLSIVTSEVSIHEIECGLNPSSDRVLTVDDQPYLPEIEKCDNTCFT